MINPEGYGLYSIAMNVYKKRRLVLLITFGAMILGAVFSLIRPKQYEAKTEFFLKNPFYADRNFIYNFESRFLDYFANEDDINRLITYAYSDTVQNEILRTTDIVKAHKFDTTDAKGMDATKRFISSNVVIFRTDKKSITLAYTDEDPVRAAKIAKLYVLLLERELRGFYNNTRNSLYESVIHKIREEDSMIIALTDTLIRIREQYGIYDIINPARQNLIVNQPKAVNTPGYARGMEELQNFESLKDQVVTDRAKHTTLINQYTTGTKMNELPLTSIIIEAKPPVRAKGIGRVMTTLSCGIIGFFFAVLYVLGTGIISRTKQNGAS